MIDAGIGTAVNRQTSGSVYFN